MVALVICREWIFLHPFVLSMLRMERMCSCGSGKDVGAKD